MAPLTCLEIFTGAGGMALGLEQAGFVHEAAVEVDPSACGTLRANRPAWMIIEADVRSVSSGTFQGIDLLCGGMPSLRQAYDWWDPFPEALRLVAEIGPRAVVLESARDLATSRFADYRGQVMARFGELGYEVWCRVVHASDHGVPQPRPRCVLVAIRPPWSGHFQWSEPYPMPPPTVGEVLYDLMGAGGWPGAGSWRDQALRIAPTIAGGSKRGGPDLGPTQARRAWKALGIDGLGIADEPPGPDFPVDQPPRLTVRMVARLQGFPDDWLFTGRKTAAYRQVSRAFPPPVARVLGGAIRHALDETSFTRHMPRTIPAGGLESRPRLGQVRAVREGDGGLGGCHLCGSLMRGESPSGVRVHRPAGRGPPDRGGSLGAHRRGQRLRIPVEGRGCRPPGRRRVGADDDRRETAQR
jgi:DNA (cytosine-5)-methyltransferase 1